MLEYKFYYNEAGNPRLLVLEDLYDLSELGSCQGKYLDEIVISLENLLHEKLEEFDFGYEVYSIDCRKDTALVIDLFEKGEVVAEIPTVEVYQMMKDWRDFLIEYYESKH
jgi:hypothetical protein